MNAIRDVRLVLLKGTKTDVTATAKDPLRQRFMRLMIDEFLDHKRNSQIGESVEDAAVYAIARVVGFVRGLSDAKMLVEIGIATDLDTLHNAEIKEKDLVIVW